MKLGLGLSINNRIDAAWTPEKLGDQLKLWLRNDTSILESDGSAAEDGEDITRWSDFSGNANHMVAENNFFDYDSATGGIESTDSTNSRLYLATDGSKNITFADGFAVYMRVSLSTISTGGNDLFVYDSDATGEDFFRAQSTTELRAKINNSTKVGFTQATQSVDTFYNFGFERDGSNVVTAYRDGSSLTKITSGGYETGAISGDFVLDAIGGLFDGIIKEVVWVDRGLTAAERTKLDAYLDKL